MPHKLKTMAQAHSLSIGAKSEIKAFVLCSFRPLGQNFNGSSLFSALCIQYINLTRGPIEFCDITIFIIYNISTSSLHKLLFPPLLQLLLLPTSTSASHHYCNPPLLIPTIEPRHEKTRLQNLRPGQTQTGLLSFRN